GEAPPLGDMPALEVRLSRMVAYTRGVVAAQIVDASGAVLAGRRGAILPDAFLDQLRREPRARLSGVAPGRGSLKGAFVFAGAPILDGQRVAGFVAAALDPGRLTSAASESADGERFVVLDAAGGVVHDSSRS